VAFHAAAAAGQREAVKSVPVRELPADLDPSKTPIPVHMQAPLKDTVAEAAAAEKLDAAEMSDTMLAIVFRSCCNAALALDSHAAPACALLSARPTAAFVTTPPAWLSSVDSSDSGAVAYVYTSDDALVADVTVAPAAVAASSA